MILKNISDFEASVQRVKSNLKDLQSCLQEIKTFPLTLSSDLPHITMWTYNKCIKSLINVFCLPIDFKINSNIKPQDLEQFKFDLNICKMEYDEEDQNQQRKDLFQNKSSPFNQNQSQNQEHSSLSSSSYSDDYFSKVKKQYRRGPYKNYTVQEKIQAVRMLMEDHCSVIDISRKLRIPCKNIKRWSQQGVERKKGGGRKRFSPQTERSVANHLKTHYKEGSEIEYTTVQDIARTLSEDIKFKASRGWVVKFVDRQHLRSYYKFV